MTIILSWWAFISTLTRSMLASRRLKTAMIRRHVHQNPAV
jgi:hypothetical protein